MKKNSFAFIAHRVEPWNWLLNFRIFNHLHRRPELHWLWIWLAPVYVLVSIMQAFGKKSFDIVDEFEFNGMKSQTILLRNYAWHFMFPGLRKKIRQRILEAVLFAQKENDVIGLGALIKAEWLTKGGRWIVDSLGDKLKAKLVHGDTLTAAACIQQTGALIKKHNITSPVFLIGATSKIGRAVAIMLARNKIHVKMYTKSIKRAVVIIKEAGKFSGYLKVSTSLKDGKDCNLWLIGKSKPSKRILLRNIPKDTIIESFSVPNPFGEWNEQPRKDLLIIEAGLLAYDTNRTNIHFMMRLKAKIIYACYAGTVVHYYKKWKHHEVDEVDLKMLKPVWGAAKEIGFSLPPLPVLEKFPVEVIEKEKRLFVKKLANVPASTIF